MYRDAPNQCPRCKTALEPLTYLTGESGNSCHACGGSFLTEGMLASLASKLLRAGLQIDWESAEHDRSDDQPQFACPTCLSPMAKKKFKSVYAGDIICVDRCSVHGLWLDLGELQEILAAAESRQS